MDLLLYNGVKIPMIGFGPGGMGYVANQRPKRLSMSIAARAWRKFVTTPYERRVLAPRKYQAYVEAIASAFKSGFRLLDYSAAYGDGCAIRDAIVASGVSRDELFLTGRISNGAQFAGANAVKNEINRILDGYGTDKVDLLMFHWPVTGHYEETWKVICEAYENGVARSIGVANCHQHHLEVLNKVGLKPMLDQFEVHPLFTQKPLVGYCHGNDIVVEGYTAIARFDDRLMRLPKLKHIADEHNKSTAQVVLRWHIQNGIIPVIRSLNERRQKENIDVFGFELSEQEMKTIDSFNINARIRYDPDNCDFTIL